ncbi:L-fuconolactonase [Paracoccus isoporae]|uniref:L-fuconolactonase n=1 Tax=Paracoccus isoporae TaxID=591205 RepID=A0A1G7E8Y4_9RHOB|nr:amidohydrolase family protein [Paracoccus isoporae]SDE60117.1 L-fuconolactonase [Paracoccus isoporae]
MKVDSHHHLWTLSRGDYGWLTPDLGAIYRDFTVADLEPLLDAAGIDRTVVVQAAPSVAETEFLLDCAAETARIDGVVGWIDMEAPEAVATLKRLARNPKFVGIRPMIQGMADDAWIMRSDLDPVFDTLVAEDLSFDALVLPRHLAPLQMRMRRHPSLRCVIDHGAKPEIASGRIDEWQREIARIAEETACMCKLSGLLTEAGDTPTHDRIRPAADHLIACFGAERLMFGSDWPVLNLAGDYAGWVEMVASIIADLPEADRNRIWAGTAQEFYRLPRA